MGLRLDGVENVSSVGMDRNYTEPRRPRSRENNRRSSYEKNHRVSGERGLNGSRPVPVPVETPLSVIIAKNDNFENGHYSTPKSGYNHLLDEDFTKKALDVIHGHSSVTTPVSSLVNSGPSTSSSVQNTSFNSPQRFPGRHEEVQKRRNIVEKIEKMKGENKFETFTSQMDLSTPNQVSMSVRRYARQDNPHLPEKMRNFILEGTADTPTAPVRKNNVQSNMRTKNEDGDATDYDDLDDTFQERVGGWIPSSSNVQWLVERGEYVVMDERIGCALDTTEQEILRLTKQLESLESLDRMAMEGMIEGRNEEEEGCARLIPWDNMKRRKLMRLEDKVVNTVASTSKEVAAFDPPTLSNRADQYIHRSSIMSSYHIRKKKKKSIWYNSLELEEEKTRNGVKKKEEREKREKRKLERAEKEEEEEDESEEYEATDDDDDEEMPTQSHSKKWNGAPKEKRRRKDADRKNSKREHNKNRRTSDCAGVGPRQVSVTSRPSFDGDMDYLTPSFNHSTWLEHFKNQRGTNFTYNKIPVPECRQVEVDNEEIDDTENLEECTTERIMEKLAAQHHILEHEERLRFTINPRGQRASRTQRGVSREQREASQESGRSRSTPSNRDASEEGDGGGEAGPSITPITPAPIQSRGRPVTSSTRPPIPPFNYDSIRPITDYQRYSTELPYERRKWEG